MITLRCMNCLKKKRRKVTFSESQSPLLYFFEKENTNQTMICGSFLLAQRGMCTSGIIVFGVL